MLIERHSKSPSAQMGHKYSLISAYDETNVSAGLLEADFSAHLLQIAWGEHPHSGVGSSAADEVLQPAK